ncbi:MAG TPA: hypothetical protein PLI43_00520 [Albidovulum sp.]|uniref:hypothetical protein n=1 Tax=Albidovulum sp. TaxID=1872424 RepID=UPI002C9BCDFB|nr:hypothetical protein [Albidovulum sp.]
MTNRAAPVFLARKSYRRRRMTDAARLLPIVGVFLILLPILWQPASTPAPDTGYGVAYLFIVWTLLIIAARVISHFVASEADASEDAPDAGDDAA